MYNLNQITSTSCPTPSTGPSNTQSKVQTLPHGLWVPMWPVTCLPFSELRCAGFQLDPGGNSELVPVIPSAQNSTLQIPACAHSNPIQVPIQVPPTQRSHFWSFPKLWILLPLKIWFLACSTMELGGWGRWGRHQIIPWRGSEYAPK